MKRIAETLGVARSNLVERVDGKRRKRGPQIRAGDAELTLRRLVDKPAELWIPADRRAPQTRAAIRRPRSRQRQARLPADEEGRLLAGPAYRAPHPTANDGTIMTSRSNERWCSDALQFSCWNSEIVRVAFALDSHDRDVISWVATTAGISGEMPGHDGTLYRAAVRRHACSTQCRPLHT